MEKTYCLVNYKGEMDIDGVDYDYYSELHVELDSEDFSNYKHDSFSGSF